MASEVPNLKQALEKISQYQKNGNTKDMFKYIYKYKELYLEELHEMLVSNSVSIDYKDDLISNELREEGNTFYKKTKLKEALEKYNECIISAPHPKLAYDKSDKNDYTPLSMGYGNRSAILYQLKEFENCICDIDRALNLCVSKITQFKLEERKIKCLSYIGRYQEAQELLQNSKILLHTLELEKSVKKCYENSLSKLSLQCTQCKKKGTLRNKSQESRYFKIQNADASTSVNVDDLIFAYNNPPPPSLDDEPNPTIPAFSSALKLQYSTDQGRYVVATRDIKPGEVLSVETAYTSHLHPKANEPNSPFNFCTFCLARCAAPIPCHECTNVVFCNEKCRTKGWDKFHMKECPVYRKLVKLGTIGAYRIIAEHSLDELKDCVSQFQKDEHRSPLDQILNKDQICDSDTYRSVYFLEGNIKNMNTQKLKKCIVGALVTTQLLIQSNRFFVNSTGDTIVPDEEDIIFIGSLFIHHMLGVNCNSYSIKETHVIAKKNNFAKGEVSVGEGTYIALSLFNHSCIPSVFILFYGNVGVCRATRFIPSGSQVYACYTAVHYCEPDRNIRRMNLINAYSFVCNCDACINDYKLSKYNFIDNSTDPKLRTKDRRISRNYLKKTPSLKLELDALMKRCNLMKTELLSPSVDINDYVGLTLETIEFFDRFVVLPNQMYMTLTDLFREIFERKSSCYYINQSEKKISNTPINVLDLDDTSIINYIKNSICFQNSDSDTDDDNSIINSMINSICFQNSDSDTDDDTSKINSIINSICFQNSDSDTDDDSLFCESSDSDSDYDYNDYLLSCVYAGKS